MVMERAAAVSEMRAVAVMQRTRRAFHPWNISCWNEPDDFGFEFAGRLLPVSMSSCGRSWSVGRGRVRDFSLATLC